MVGFYSMTTDHLKTKENALNLEATTGRYNKKMYKSIIIIVPVIWLVMNKGCLMRGDIESADMGPQVSHRNN